MSLAGDLAAASRRQAASQIGYYNLLLGPTAWRFSSGLGLDYNDNVRLQSDHAEDDLILRPRVNAEMNWPVTLRNTLHLTVGAGYSAYFQHSDLDQFFLNPGSGLSFDIYVGDFVINLHDRAFITENAYQNQSVAGNRTYVSLQNDVGVNALWDLNRIVLSSGYDHVNYVSLNSGAQRQPDGSSDNFFVNGGLRVAPEILAGLEAGGSLISYDQTQTSNSVAFPDGAQWNVGAFCSAKISQYMDARLDAGFTSFTPSVTSTNFSDSTGLYVHFLLTHRLNQYVNYALNAGRTFDFTYNGQPYDRYFVRLEPRWNFVRRMTFSTPVWWEHGTEVYYRSASYDQYGGAISVARQLTKKLSGGLSWRHISQSSDRASLDYTDNIVSLSFAYQF